MVDVMRQQPEKKKKVVAKVSGKQEGEKRDSPAASFAQKDSTVNKEAIACYCCGDADCRLNRCEKKNIWPKEKWFKPEYFKEKYHKTHKKQVTYNNEIKQEGLGFIFMQLVKEFYAKTHEKNVKQSKLYVLCVFI